MINLAGRPDADAEIRRELERARLEIVELDRTKLEVSATLAGKFGPWTFTRAWYYWVAAAPDGQGIPIELARELYKDPVGKTDVRVGGHCGCPAPDEYGATYLDAEGRLLMSEKDRETMEHFIKHDLVDANVMDGRAFTADPRKDFYRATIDLYHIDTEVGLRLFADVLLVATIVHHTRMRKERPNDAQHF